MRKEKASEILIFSYALNPEEDLEAEERLQETDDEGIERDSGESEDDPLHQMPDGHGYIRRTTPPPRQRPPARCSVNSVLQVSFLIPCFCFFPISSPKN